MIKKPDLNNTECHLGQAPWHATHMVWQVRGKSPHFNFPGLAIVKQPVSSARHLVQSMLRRICVSCYSDCTELNVEKVQMK